MYGFDVSKLIQATTSSGIQWMPNLLPIMRANCGWLYDVDLYVRYGTDSHPAPGTTDNTILIREGQLLQCNGLLVGSWYREHPVKCTITDEAGEVVPGFPKTKWLIAGGGENETDFFRNVLLSPGRYNVEWSVCGEQSSHYLVVEAYGFTTNDIDIEIIVTDTTGIDANAAWNTIEADVVSKMLVHNATVKFKWAETKGRYLVIFHLEVTAPPEVSIGDIGVVDPVSIAVILLLIASIVYFLVAVPAIEQRRIAQLAYNTTFQKYTYEECADMLWNEWVACMADKYPVVWNNIKDKIEQPKPPPPAPDWLTYIMYIILAVGAMAGVVIFVKYVLPALKGRR